MKVLWLMGLVAIALLMVSAEEKVPDGFQQWTGASLKELEQLNRAGASANLRVPSGVSCQTQHRPSRAFGPSASRLGA